MNEGINVRKGNFWRLEGGLSLPARFFSESLWARVLSARLAFCMAFKYFLAGIIREIVFETVF
jgi:hypothetical protein